jgi:hypothetical protein
MLSTQEVCRRSRATYRQVDYWIRAGVIAPAIASANGSGTRRAFTEDQVRVVRLVADLAALGATTPVLTRAAAWASLHPFEAWHGLAYVDDEGFVSTQAPGGSCWAVDLAECSACTAHSAVA